MAALSSPGEVAGHALPAAGPPPGAPLPCTNGPAALETCFPGIDLHVMQQQLEKEGMKCFPDRELADLYCKTGSDDHGVAVKIAESFDAPGKVTGVRVVALEGGVDVPAGVEQRILDLLELGLKTVLPLFFPGNVEIARDVLDQAAEMVGTCPPPRKGPVVPPGYRVGCDNPRVITIEGPAGVATAGRASVTVWAA